MSAGEFLPRLHNHTAGLCPVLTSAVGVPAASAPGKIDVQIATCDKPVIALTGLCTEHTEQERDAQRMERQVFSLLGLT